MNTDKRIKLTDAQRLEIIEARTVKKLSLRAIGELYGVSAKCVMMVVDPEYYEKCKIQNNTYAKTHRPSKEKRTETMRRYRAHKKEIASMNNILANAVQINGDKIETDVTDINPVAVESSEV